jgi:hypothetical protein
MKPLVLEAFAFEVLVAAEMEEVVEAALARDSVPPLTAVASLHALL